MAAKKTSTKKPVARKKGKPDPKVPVPTLKVPASVTITFGKEPKRFFATSLNKQADIKNWVGSEHDLVTATLQLCPHFSLDALIHEGIQRICKSELATQLSKKAAKAEWGIRGQADDRLAKAVEFVRSDNETRKKAGKKLRKLTPNIVGNAAEQFGGKVNYETAKRYLIHHGLLEQDATPPQDVKKAS